MRILHLPHASSVSAFALSGNPRITRVIFRAEPGTSIPRTTLPAMQESRLHDLIFERSAQLSRRFPYVRTGPGDDCAVVDIPSPNGPSAPCLLTVDHLVEGRHFDRLGPSPSPDVLEAVARKAIARSVSDIAAMGGTPHASLATACLPSGFPQATADALFDKMHRWAEHWHAPLVGGDLATFGDTGPGHGASNATPIVLTVTLLGIPHPRRGPILRSTARPGDLVYVTGKLGGSLPSRRHLTFEPRTTEGLWIADQLADYAARTPPDRAATSAVGAMLDLSDGLGRDGARLARASRARLELDAASLPTHEGCSWREAMSDGEDYELLFTAPPDLPLPASTPNSTHITRIGRVVAGEGCSVRLPDGTSLDAAAMGWEHE